MKLIQFAFIVLLPLVVVAGAVLSFFAIGAIFDTLDNPAQLRSRVEGLFHGSATVKGRDVRPGHYYRPYWARR